MHNPMESFSPDNLEQKKLREAKQFLNAINFDTIYDFDAFEVVKIADPFGGGVVVFIFKGNSNQLAIAGEADAVTYMVQNTKDQEIEAKLKHLLN
jgi:hypothetical protein